MPDVAATKVRERAVLMVFNHSGATPRAVEEIEVTAVNGIVVERTSRRPNDIEGATLVRQRFGPIAAAKTEMALARERGDLLAATSAFLRADWEQTKADSRRLFGRERG